jgi:hypothetical protein
MFSERPSWQAALMSIAVLAVGVVLCAGEAAWMLYRGVVLGIRRRVIVVRYVTYTGRPAFRWGVVCIVYAVFFAAGAYAAVTLLLRELSR